MDTKQTTTIDRLIKDINSFNGQDRTNTSLLSKKNPYYFESFSKFALSVKYKQLYLQCRNKQTKTNKMKLTRTEILEVLDMIEAQLKGINVDSDNNGNFERSDLHTSLIEREDKFMELLQNYPIT